MANSRREGTTPVQPPRCSIDRWPETAPSRERKELVDHLADKVAIQHLYGPRSGPLLVDVSSPLAMQAQLVARTLGRAFTHGVAPPSVVSAVVRAQALPPGSPGLLAWQAAFVRRIEAHRWTLGWRRVHGRDRFWSESAFVEDLGAVFAHVGGPDESSARREALMAAFRGVRLVGGRTGRGRLTAAGVAERWCRVLDLPFPAQRRSRKTRRRVEVGVALGLPRPRPVEVLCLFEPRPRPTLEPPAGGETRVVGAWGAVDGRHAVELALAHPFVEEPETPVDGKHLALLVDAFVRLVTVGWFQQATAAHVQLAEDIVTRVRARDSPLSLGQACWMHVVGWLLRPPGITTAEIEEVRRAATVLVPDPALVEAVQSADEGVLRATLPRSTSAFVIARAWAGLGGHEASWPAFLQRSRRASGWG